MTAAKTMTDEELTQTIFDLLGQIAPKPIPANSTRTRTCAPR